jgi:hypothetical protein
MNMVKVIFRILLILIVIALLSGALYALVQNTSLGASFGRGDFGSRAFTGQTPGVPISGSITGTSLSPGRFGEGGEGRFSFSLLRGLGGVLGNTIAIGAITLFVVLVRKPRAPRLLRVRPVSIDQP